ncbi:MAG TPA: hypothetical protein VER17_08030 [Tepidisphaeraceae bacterium]|nr:hypothetical protein [Tepidisphaeraceae bacterium]
MDDAAPDRASGGGPARLEYFAPNEPDRRRARGVVLWSVVLLLSWGPYLCGLVSASTVARSYVPETTRSHANAAMIGFAAGLVLSSTSLAWFTRGRHWPGTIAAAAVVAMQLCIAVCAGAG